jgi:hypothetical protein
MAHKRRSRRRHTLHKTPRKPPTSFDEKILKIGENDDVPILGYAWSKVPPLVNLLPKSKSTFLSLKAICAERVAENIDSIESFDDIPWSCWLLVWNCVLANGTDSFHTFCIFASKLIGIEGFRCHGLIGNGSDIYESNSEAHDDSFQLLELRRSALEQIRVPFISHRVENFFANTFISELATYLHRYEYTPNVLLDISLVKVEDYFAMFNISNLLALNVGEVDDSFLYNLGSAMVNDGKLKTLQVLRLADSSNISEKAVVRLFEMVNENDCSLEYIQTDFQVPRDVLGRTRWKMMDTDRNEVNLIARLPLGLKIYMIHRYKLGDFAKNDEFRSRSRSRNSGTITTPYSGTITTPYSGPSAPSIASNSTTSATSAPSSPRISISPQLQNHILLDIMIHNKIYVENDPYEEETLMSTWSSRIQQRSSQRFAGYSYLIDKSKKDPLKEISPVVVPPKTIKRVKPNAKKFFSI